MNSLQKTISGALVLVLAFFAGSFCLHPMAAQAMDGADTGEDMVMLSYASVNTADATFGICVFDCIRTAPQALAVKKFSVDSSADLLADDSDDRRERLLAFSFGTTDFLRVHPPSPDILSSVFKKE